jgi:hypothetical protein
MKKIYKMKKIKKKILNWVRKMQKQSKYIEEEIELKIIKMTNKYHLLWKIKNINYNFLKNQDRNFRLKDQGQNQYRKATIKKLLKNQSKIIRMESQIKIKLKNNK